MIPDDPLSDYNGEELVLIGENHTSQESYSLERNLALSLKPEYLLYEGLPGSDEELNERVCDEGPYLSLINLMNMHRQEFSEQLMSQPIESLYQQAKLGRNAATLPVFDLPKSDMALIMESIADVEADKISTERREFLENALGRMRTYYNELVPELTEIKKSYMMIDSAYKNKASGHHTDLRRLDREKDQEINDSIRTLQEMDPEAILSQDLDSAIEDTIEVLDATETFTERLEEDKEREEEMRRRISDSLEKAGDRPVIAVAGSLHIENIQDDFETDTYTIIEEPWL